MTRRIVRTAIQAAVAVVVTFFIILFLDRNFRVLPTAIHEYMPQHHAGLVIVDVDIATCSRLKPFSSCQLDPQVWHRIEKDLFLGQSSFSSAYLHLRRKKEEELTADDRVLVDLTVGRLNPADRAAQTQAQAQGGGSSDKAAAGDGKKPSAKSKRSSGSEEPWEARPAGLWIRRSAKRHASDSKDAVTGVDLLFGDDAVEARDGWDVVGVPLLLDARSSIPGAHVTIRRGRPQEPHKPVPRINDNGKFKIVQLADLHLSTGTGRCRDSLPKDWNKGKKCEADLRTLDFVNKILDEEKPDLVVLSGDQVNGDTAPDAQTAIFKYAHLLIKRKLPYVTIFGNHDDEGSLSRAGQMALIEALPYSLSEAGPKDIDGVGNYYVEVLARGGSSHSALTLYMLDTHAYSPDERKYKGYNWIKKTQIDWFRQTAQSLKKKHREYTHIHMDLSFIHIPLPEYRAADQIFIGEWKEPVTAPVFNSGFRDALVDQGVVMVSCGHDHVNEYCALSMTDPEDPDKPDEVKPALWMCYGGATGFGGYAGYGGYHRKIRVFDLDMNEARITTWKRVEWGEDTDKRIDEQIIVDAGHPVAPPAE